MLEKLPLTPEQFRFIVRHAPLVSIDLLISDPEGRLLLGMRNNEPARGCWFVPGGIIFKGERLEAAFRRILMAEVGLDRSMNDAQHLGLFEHFYDTNRYREPGYGTHYVVNAFRLALESHPVVTADSQHREMVWMRPDEILESPNVHPHVQAYLRS